MKKLDIETIRENGNFIESYPIDEGYVSNAGIADVYSYKGKVYEIIIYSNRAQEHEEGDEVINEVKYKD